MGEVRGSLRTQMWMMCGERPAGKELDHNSGRGGVRGGLRTQMSMIRVGRAGTSRKITRS